MSGNENQSVSGELCIVGAGIAGLNALFVATQYLTANDTVILIDRGDAPGGMWNDTYDYVRLHQPHKLFTAGNIDWALNRKPGYLASKDEVLAHFQTCMAELRTRVNLIEYYGYEFQSQDEIVLNGSYTAEITCENLDASKTTLRVTAKRCIKAFGFRVPTNPPLTLSSQHVHSISPQDDVILAPEFGADNKPIFIVGGGKTAMDTAHSLITRHPGREITLIAGKGTVFSSRNVNFPEGLSRYWGASTTTEAFLDLCLRYNGDNGNDVLAYFKKHRGVCLHEDCGQFMFGVLSEEENETIRQGLKAFILDYALDVVDDEDGPVIFFKSGDRQVIEPDSWVINCTGYVMREEYPYEPYLSTHGTIASVQPTSAIHFLTTFASYFLSHLFFRNELHKLPLYEVDYQTLLRTDKIDFTFTAMTHMMHNTMAIMNVVPAKIMLDCGLDFDRWFPMYRRMFGAVKLKRNYEQYMAHFRRTLDRVHDKHGVRCGLLPRSDLEAA